MHRVREHFLKHNVILPEQLLAAVFREASQREDAQSIEVSAFEIWKNSDLRIWCTGKDIKSPLTEILSKKEIVCKIAEPLVLQIDYLRDISRPAYQQLQKAINRFGENVLINGDAEAAGKKVVENGKRMLMINMTDGVREIQGMEYMPIAQLNTDIPPGTKVRLLPPLICRRGIFLLKHGNVQLLGGKVSELEGKYSQKCILASLLKADLVAMEKSTPPCPPPIVNLPNGAAHSQTFQQPTPGLRRQAPQPVPATQDHDIAFDPDGDALIADIPDDWMETEGISAADLDALEAQIL